MALINKTGITTGGTVQAEHVTRAIDALSGVSTDTIIASGSFTGATTGSVLLNKNSVISGITVTSVGAEFTYDLDSKMNLTGIGKGVGLAIPLITPNAPTTGSMYFDSATPALWIYDGTQWVGFAPTLP